MSNEEIKYTRPPDNVPCIMGLQAWKSNIICKGYKGPSRGNPGTMADEPDVYGFRPVWRGYKDPKAFCSEELKGYAGGKLLARVSGMCPVPLGSKVTAPEVASLMATLTNHWYLVTPGTKLTKAGKPWSIIVNVAALPPELCPEMRPHEYFDSLGGIKVPPAINTAEHYLETFSRTRQIYAAVKEGKPIPTFAEAKPVQETMKATGFEAMPDTGTVHYWDITNVAPHMLEKAEVLLKKAGGAQVGPFEWETPTIVEPLLKYKREKPQTDFDKDSLGDGF